MLENIKSLCEFIDASPTAFHAADSIAAYLAAHGSRSLSEGEAWSLEPGTSYHVVRGGRSVVAFRTGYGNIGDTGFAMTGAHTDSPGLKIRGRAERSDKGLRRIAVDVYGGAILSGWTDRPLALSGRIVARASTGHSATLFRTHEAVGIIPSLAIHLNRDINKGFELNAHNHLPVLVASGADSCAFGSPKAGGIKAEGLSWVAEAIARETGVEGKDILAFEAYFHDAQKALSFGDGLVNAPRLDDLAGCMAIAKAYCAAEPGARTQIACFLDAEEIGSATAQGAASSFVRDILARISLSAGSRPEDFYRALPKSLFVSVDAAQAWNPAYPEKYDEGLTPKLGKGVALKINANQKYATDCETEALFSRLCADFSIPWQTYMAKADMQPGSTIGPISASRLGMPAVDIGHPLLSMHAVRETLAAQDHEAMLRILTLLFSAEA